MSAITTTREVEYVPPRGVVDLNSVTMTLIDMMKEVKQNPATIPQATAMCEIANRVCDIAKVQVAQANMVIELTRIKSDNSN